MYAKHWDVIIDKGTSSNRGPDNHAIQIARNDNKHKMKYAFYSESALKGLHKTIRVVVWLHATVLWRRISIGIVIVIVMDDPKGTATWIEQLNPQIVQMVRD